MAAPEVVQKTWHAGAVQRSQSSVADSLSPTMRFATHTPPGAGRCCTPVPAERSKQRSDRRGRESRPNTRKTVKNCPVAPASHVPVAGKVGLQCGLALIHCGAKLWMFNVFGRPLGKALRSAPPERKSRPDHGGHWLTALMGLRVQLNRGHSKAKRQK